MYQYDAYDQTIVNQRVAQYRDQTKRYLAGELSDDEFRPSPPFMNNLNPTV